MHCVYVFFLFIIITQHVHVAYIENIHMVIIQHKNLLIAHLQQQTLMYFGQCTWIYLCCDYVSAKVVMLVVFYIIFFILLFLQLDQKISFEWVEKHNKSINLEIVFLCLNCLIKQVLIIIQYFVRITIFIWIVLKAVPPTTSGCITLRHVRSILFIQYQQHK